MIEAFFYVEWAKIIKESGEIWYIFIIVYDIVYLGTSAIQMVKRIISIDDLDHSRRQADINFVLNDWLVSDWVSFTINNISYKNIKISWMNKRNTSINNEITSIDIRDEVVLIVNYRCIENLMLALWKYPQLEFAIKAIVIYSCKSWEKLVQELRDCHSNVIPVHYDHEERWDVSLQIVKKKALKALFE